MHPYPAADTMDAAHCAEVSHIGRLDVKNIPRPNPSPIIPIRPTPSYLMVNYGGRICRDRKKLSQIKTNAMAFSHSNHASLTEYPGDIVQHTENFGEGRCRVEEAPHASPPSPNSDPPITLSPIFDY